jgi:hypothetical protein
MNSNALVIVHILGTHTLQLFTITCMFACHLTHTKTLKVKFRNQIIKLLNVRICNTKVQSWFQHMFVQVIN